MSTLPALRIGPVLAVTTSTQVLTTLGALALAAVAPKAAAELGISPALIGYQVAIVYFGALIAALLGGALVRRLGATRTSQCGLWLVAAGCVISTLGSLAAIAAGAWVIGLGYGVTNPAASHLLARASIQRNMNLVFSLKQSGVPIGGVISGVLLPTVTLAYGWKAGLWTCALLATALSIALVPAQRRWDTDRTGAAFGNPLASLVLVWQRPVLRWIAIASFALSAVQLCLTGFLVTYLVAEAGLSLLAAGTVLSVTHAAGAVGRLAWGWVADRMRSGSAALIANGLVAMAGALATAAIGLGWPIWAITLASISKASAIRLPGCAVSRATEAAAPTTAAPVPMPTACSTTADAAAAHGATPERCAMNAIPASAQTFPGTYLPRFDTVQMRAALHGLRRCPHPVSICRHAAISIA